MSHNELEVGWDRLDGVRRKEEIIPGDGITPLHIVTGLPHPHQRPSGPEDASSAQHLFADRFDCIFIS